jgi:hypothetical protein
MFSKYVNKSRKTYNETLCVSQPAYGKASNIFHADTKPRVIGQRSKSCTGDGRKARTSKLLETFSATSRTRKRTVERRTAEYIAQYLKAKRAEWENEVFVQRRRVAAFFGLIHGLAFASTLDRLGLARWDRVAGILSFDLGIKAMQLLVVALVLPSLLMMSRTRAYPTFRITGAAFACVASAMWIAERLLNIQTPIDAVVNVVAQRGIVCAVLLFAASLLCQLLDERSEAFKS